MRLRNPDDPWLIPVRFDECDIPDWEIGGGRTLTSIQGADFFGDRSDDSAARLVAAVQQILGGHSDAEVIEENYAPNASAPAITDRGQVATGDINEKLSISGALPPPKRGFALTIPAAHAKGVNSVVFSPNGKLLASGGNDGKIRLWDVATGRRIGKQMGQLAPVFSVAFSPDGTTLASSGKDSVIRLFEVGTGKKLQSLRILRICYVWALAFSPDGAMLASAAGRGIRLWDVATGRLAANFRGQAAISVAFGAEGTLLASGGRDKTVRIWDLETGRNFATLTGHTRVVQSVAFSQNGTILASGGDSTIRIWEMETGRNLLTLIGSTGNRLLHSVRSVSFNLDDTLLASSGNGNVLLWDMETGRKVVALTGHTAEVLSVAFSPRDSLLASGGLDETIRLWDI